MPSLARTAIELVFWFSVLLVLYVYAGYPLLLMLLPKRRQPRSSGAATGPPGVSILIPAQNEEAHIGRKLRNTLDLSYPPDRREIIVVSDASTDRTNETVAEHAGDGGELIVLPERSGKAAALNLGLERSRNEIIVFSDASIMLEQRALLNIVRPFESATIGCVSGEDRIPGDRSEGFYGVYEIFLRNLESRVSSIVGASGCFYAQRRSLCRPFPQGMAPDFVSVLATVERGFRAVTEPTAVGEMRGVREGGHEYQRKVRTILRGITAMMHYLRLLNPLRHGLFAVQLISHKVLRWAVGLLLVLIALCSALLWSHPLYLGALVLQALFYACALVGSANLAPVSRWMPFRIPYFFTMVNFAALSAAARYLAGARQEIWEPSRR